MPAPVSGASVKPKTAPRAPTYTMGPSGFATNTQGSVNPNDPKVAAALAASKAANPNASMNYSGPPIDQYPGQNAPATDPYSVDGDPILAKIKAGNETARTNARANAQASAKALAIQFGDATGFGQDATTAAEASANPYSTLATLLKNYNDTGLAHDEALNQNNLYYSGARAKTLTEDAGNYQHGVYDARNAALDAYGGIQSTLASALSGADTADTGALSDAYSRAGQRAATYGIDPGAGSTAPPPPPPPSGGTAPPPLASTYGTATGPYIGTLPAKAPPAPLASAISQVGPYIGTANAPKYPKVKVK